MPPPAKKTPATPTRKTRSQAKEQLPVPTTVAPEAAVSPEAGEILTEESAELHLFDVASGVFMLQDPKVTVAVSEVGQWQCMFLSPRLSQEMDTNGLFM